MATSIIRGETEEISQNGQKLVNFSGDLEQELNSIKNVIDEIVESTYGSASEKLTTVYYQLDADLRKFVEELETLGTNVQTSASNMETVDDSAANSLTYEG